MQVEVFSCVRGVGFGCDGIDMAGYLLYQEGRMALLLRMD
jgi:hypothetical protein